MLDIAKNRQAQKYSTRIIILRILWSIAHILFRYSPRPAFGWRNFILRLFGAKIGQQVHIYNSAIIYMPWNLEIGDWSSIGEWALIYNLEKVTVGQHATISYRAHICCGTHDYTSADLSLIKLPVSIGDQAWVCTDVFVGPGVEIGCGAIAGARSVVTKKVEPWTIVAGNPAQHIKDRVLTNE